MTFSTDVDFDVDFDLEFEDDSDFEMEDQPMEILNYLSYMTNHKDKKFTDNILLGIMGDHVEVWNTLSTRRQHQIAEQLYNVLRVAYYDAPDYVDMILNNFPNTIKPHWAE